MSRHVTSPMREDLLRAVRAVQTREVGSAAPCRETKWTGWRVVEWGGALYAIVTDASGDIIDCAEKIEPSELSLYVDDAPGEEDASHE